jgi:hypothetical protein
VRLKSIDKRYGSVLQYNTSDMFNESINSNSLTEITKTVTSIPVTNGKDFMVIINNDDVSEPTPTYDTTIMSDKLKIVIAADLQYKQSLDVLVVPQKATTFNTQESPINDKKIELFINFDDGNTVIPTLIQEFSLPVLKNKNATIYVDEPHVGLTSIPEWKVRSVLYSKEDLNIRKISFLVDSDLINKYRVHKIPDNVEIKRICMGIDPSGDSGKNNDLTTKKADAIGIVTCFKGSDSHYYLLRDDTMNGSPAQWGAKCVEVYEAEKADVMSVEKNFGGAMCEHTIRSMTNNDMIKIKNTTSSKGKLLRAEPISALYEQGLVHHIGNFPELEDEMVSYMGTGNSPNRLDSLVFALTELATPEQYTELLPVMGLRN